MMSSKIYPQHEEGNLKNSENVAALFSTPTFNLARLFDTFLLRLFQSQESFDIDSEKVFNELILQEQTESHTEKENLFYWVRHGDLNTLKERISAVLEEKHIEGENLINKRDAVGGHIIHQAYLLENYKIGRWLVQKYPHIALKSYDGVLSDETLKNKPDLDVPNYKDLMPNTGENILHMVIVRRNYEEVRWLLDFYKDHKDSVPGGLAKLLTANATGKFFDQKGNFYYGGYPLQFAVCSDNIEIFDLVLSFTSSLNNDAGKRDPAIFMRDAFGNTVLHLCVVHCLQSMYRHVFKTAETIIKKEIKLLYVEEIAKEAGNGPYNLKDLKALDESSSGYKVKPKSLNKPQLDKFEEWAEYEAKVKVQERLILALNNDLQSPLTLAAARMRRSDLPDMVAEKVKMFRFLLDMHKNVLYDYGIVSFAEIDLLGLDVEYDFQEYEKSSSGGVVASRNIRSAIDWMCLNRAEKAVIIPDVRKVIEAKWQRCGIAPFVNELVVNVALVVCMTLISIFINVVPTTSPHIFVVGFTSVLYLIVWAILFGLLLFEVIAICRNPQKYKLVNGVPVFNIVCKVLKIATFALFCAFRIREDHYDRELADDTMNYRNDLAVKLNLGVCLLTSWIHMYYYLMPLERTGPFMLTLARVIGDALPNFLQFLVIIIIAFACALALLADNGDCGDLYGFSVIFKVIWVLIQDTLHPSISPSILVADISNVADNLQWLNDFLMVFYYGIVNIVMLNILIAVINAIYSYYTALDEESGTFNNEATLLVAKYNIVKYMECFYSEEDMLTYRGQYCTIQHLDRDFCPYDMLEDSPKEGKRELTKYTFQVREKASDYWAADSLKDGQYSTNKIINVLIVDPQNDFHPSGTLPVPGADEDSKRIATFIKNNKARIHNIIVTLESRAQYHISHPLFWKGVTGSPPKVFTVISNQDIRNKVWVPRAEGKDVLEWCLTYTTNLEEKGMRKLTIWPEHCIVGSTGHAVVPVINEALQDWAMVSNRPVKYVMKCQSWKTESYSALEAEFVDPADFSTSMNMDLLYTLRMSDQVLYCNVG